MRSPRGSGSTGGSDVPGGPASQAGSGQAKGGSKAKSTGGSLLELAAIIVIAVLLALGIQAFIVKPYKIPSGSMEPTLKIGQRVLVNRIGMRFDGPYVGEIVVFHPPKGADQEESHEAPKCGPSSRPADYGGAACDQTYPAEASVNFIKRVVAGPGDIISIREGHVYRNGKREQDSYINPCGGVAECNFLDPDQDSRPVTGS